MTQRQKAIERIRSGTADANIPFGELRGVLSALGFQERIRGSHHIFTRDGTEEILNIQEKSGKAKPYQVKQVRNVLLKYKLGGEVDV